MAEKFSTMNEILRGTGKTATVEQLAELKKWESALIELDRELINNDRRHAYWRDGRDITVLDRAGIMANEDNWLEYIFSQTPEDLYELVEDKAVSGAMRTLTAKQKEALYYSEVRCCGSKYIADKLGGSERNVRGHRQAAIRKIVRLAGDTAYRKTVMAV
jgi:DNA-directed RNA polymerase specialized sigma24 family protein